MNRILDILKRLIATALFPLAGRIGAGLLIAALLTACAHDDLVAPEPAEGDGDHYVELLIAVPYANSLTRGNPLGGEEGNGREEGVLNEDKIHDINIFFYYEKDNLGMDSPDDTEIKYHFYYNLRNSDDQANSELLENTKLAENKTEPSSNTYYGTQYVSLKFTCTEELINNADGINFLAVANAGPITVKENMTLGDLTSTELAHYGNTWTSSYDAFSMDASKMDYFLMSTAYNEEYTYGGQSTGTNKITKDGTDGKKCMGTTTLQRLYARLDLWYNKDQICKADDSDKVKELDYQIVDKDGDEKTNKQPTTLGHHVYITNVLPVNVMQKPSYLFKKVTDGLSSFDKSNFTSSTSYKWGGKETPSGVPTSSSNDRPTNYVMERTTLQKSTDGSGDIENWYGNTRTTEVAKNIKDTDKGKLSGFYDMERPGGSSNKDDYDYNYGCNHISIISYANENTHPTDCFHSNYLTGMAFRGVYVPEIIYTAYDKDTDVLTPLKNDAEFPISTIESEKTKIYRYSPTGQYSNEYQKPNPELQLEQKSKYFTSETAAQSYAEAHPTDKGIITEYEAVKHTDEDGNEKWGFVCYYNLWLRHYNDVEDSSPSNPHAHLPMEYATVRNNIYRVAVDFSGPGDPTPTMREPDTMKARIFVRKWNYREEDELIFN